MAKQKTQRLKPRLKSLRRFRKLSDLMEVAIKDLRLVERQKKTYRIWMGDWHEPKSDGKCAVCLAGSVMAAFGLGIMNKLLEPQIGAVLGKILILALIILFIQKRPQGLFALKGRVID